MKRLTERDSDGNVNILNDKDPSGGYYIRDLDFEEDAELLCGVAEKLAEYEDLEEQGLLIEIPEETDKGFVSYIYQGSIYVVKIEQIGHVVSKRNVLKFYHDFDEAKAVLNSMPPSSI